MKRLPYLLLLMLLVSCHPSETNDGSKNPVPAFSRGADISWITEMEAKGYRFFDADGNATECTALMKQLGFDAVRYRVWVNPANGYNSVDDVLQKALRAQVLGLHILIDFHYSDTWADPGKQGIPTAWKDFSLTDMTAAVADHTRRTLQTLRDAGVDVSWVQVGNEVNTGMLWPMGKVTDRQVLPFVQLFNAGADAVREVYPDAKVILHRSNGYDYNGFCWFLDLVQRYGIRYDIIGASLYPSYWEDGRYPDWRPKTEAFVQNIPLLRDRYRKPVMLVEVGMPAAQPTAAREMLSWLIAQTEPIDDFLGIFYWEPESEQSRNGYAYGAFAAGRPTAALEAFQK